MCVIAVKPKGIDMPTDEVLQQMWNTNRDGAGFMYNDEGRVHIKKGFMTFDDFKRNLQSVYDELTRRAINLKEDVSFVYHFRIATHGTVIPENTHPFPVSSDIDALKALDVSTDLGMAHNGVIRTLDNDLTHNLTDTATFVKDVLVPFKAFFSSAFLQLANITKFIGNTINASRLAFLDGEGNVTKIGSWTTGECQLDYSNKNHVPYTPPKTTTAYTYDDDDDLYSRLAYMGRTRYSNANYLPACIIREIDLEDVTIKVFSAHSVRPHIVSTNSSMYYYLTHDSEYLISSYTKIGSWSTYTPLTVYDTSEFEVLYEGKDLTYGDMELLDMGTPYSVSGFKTDCHIPDTAFHVGTLEKTDLLLKEIPSKGYTMYDSHTQSYYPEIPRDTLFMDEGSNVYMKASSGKLYAVKDGCVTRDSVDPTKDPYGMVDYETLYHVAPSGEVYNVKAKLYKGVKVYE